MDDDRIKLKTEPQYIVLAFIYNSNLEEVQSDPDEIDINFEDETELLPVSDSHEFKEGDTDWRISQVMNDLFIDYIDYRMFGTTFRMVRNKKYKMEGYN